MKSIKTEISNDISSWIETEIPEEGIKKISGFSKELTDNTSKWEDQRRFKGNKVQAQISSVEIKTSQLRKFYGEVKRIQANGIEKEKNAFRMLKPKLAYAVGRQVDSEVNYSKKVNKYFAKHYRISDLYSILEKAINSVQVDDCEGKELKKRFSNFTQLFEAIVAYHKFHGGKD